MAEPFTRREALQDTHEKWRRAESLLRTIAEESEALNVDLASGSCDPQQARARVQNIHGLAVTTQVDSE